jgi:hypothetical protein
VKKSFLALLALRSIMPVQSLANENGCGSEKSVVYFVNGVRNTRNEAKDSLRSLIDIKAFRTDQSKKIEYKLSYNPTNGLFDFYEVLKQKLAEERQLLLDAIYKQNYDLNKPTREFLLDYNRKFIEEQSADVSQHIATYKSDILEGNRIFLVSHSQGNFFANSAYLGLSLEERKSVGNFQVATPSSSVASGGGYLRFNQDLVIKALETAASAIPGAAPVLPANFVVNSKYVTDPLVHGFTDAYLADPMSRSRIISALKAGVEAVPFPEKKAEKSALTFTLSWGNDEPDVDLHVAEPSGRTVYFANPTGTNGFLDLDDTDFNGPEHYYGSCENLPTGKFSVSLTNYTGKASPVAMVNIKAGTKDRSFRVQLPPAAKANLPVGSVDVKKNEESGEYSFEIQGI